MEEPFAYPGERIRILTGPRSRVASDRLDLERRPPFSEPT
jgi:hypothetical protein